MQTKVYYTIDGKKYFKTYAYLIDSFFSDLVYKENVYLSRDDGPAVEYAIDFTRIYNSSINKEKFLFGVHSVNLGIEKFTKQTNHILCDICNDFCKQRCFILYRK